MFSACGPAALYALLLYSRMRNGSLLARNNTSTPGSVLPSSDSRKAPPAVDTWVNRPVTPSDVERRHGVAAAGKADKPAGLRQFRDRFGHFDRAVIERLELEGAERTVPDQRLGAGQHRDDMLDAARADVEDHVVGADLVHRDDARGGVRGEFLRDDDVDRQHDFAVQRFGLGQNVARRLP